MTESKILTAACFADWLIDAGDSSRVRKELIAHDAEQRAEIERLRAALKEAVEIGERCISELLTMEASDKTVKEDEEARDRLISIRRENGL